ncbi:MAG: hypothetical protein EOP05_05790 [Proteobacteria bacterium]|nr:MAG: hypothetical protein EOP05_05790 [Pseudomonadota bacterium]
MRLATLLEQQNSTMQTPGSLKDCFGDSYLCAKNAIYGRIREAALAAGFQFSNKPNAAYSALSLSQLDEILRTKQIPYNPNLPVLIELESRLPKQILWDDISDNLKGTHVFHESCHAVARSFGLPSSSSDSSVKILAMLLEESFANTCELLSILDAADQVHRIFLELNSYVFMLEDRAGLLNAAKDLGRPTLFTFMFLSYLHSNFLRPLSEKDFENCFVLAMEVAGEKRVLDQKQKKTLRALSKIAFQLNPRFREVTTQFHLKLHGIKSSVEEIASVDVLGLLRKQPAALNFLKQASRF